MILSQRQLTQGTIVVNVDQGNTQLTVMVSLSSGANSEASDAETYCGAVTVSIRTTSSATTTTIYNAPAITGEISSKRRRVQRGYYAGVVDDDSQEMKRRR
ncbi:hypothetical protein E5D57_013458 [Metarhizium anisopliae]|nr:hypothetical protein E5D57_013458 [Metarhizium anisopliae]